MQKITIPKSNILELKRKNESLVVETKDHITVSFLSFFLSLLMAVRPVAVLKLSSVQHVFLPLGKNRELLFERLQAIEDSNLWTESQSQAKAKLPEFGVLLLTQLSIRHLNR